MVQKPVSIENIQMNENGGRSSERRGPLPYSQLRAKKVHRPVSTEDIHMNENGGRYSDGPCRRPYPQPRAPFSKTASSIDTRSSFGRRLDDVEDISRKASVALPPHLGNSPRIGYNQGSLNKSTIPNNKHDYNPVPPYPNRRECHEMNSVNLRQRVPGIGRGRAVKFPHQVSPMQDRPGLMQSSHSPEKQGRFLSNSTNRYPGSNVWWDDDAAWRKKLHDNFSSPGKHRYGPLSSSNNHRIGDQKRIIQDDSSPDKIVNGTPSPQSREKNDIVIKSPVKPLPGITIVPRNDDRTESGRNDQHESMDQKPRLRVTVEKKSARKEEAERQILDSSPRMTSKPSPYASTSSPRKTNASKDMSPAKGQIKSPYSSTNSPRQLKQTHSDTKPAGMKNCDPSPGRERSYPRGQSELESQSSPTFHQSVTPSRDRAYPPRYSSPRIGSGRCQGRRISHDHKDNRSPTVDKKNNDIINKETQKLSTTNNARISSVVSSDSKEMKKDNDGKTQKSVVRKYSQTKVKCRGSGSAEDIDDILDWFETMFQRQSQRLRAINTISKGPMFLAEKEMPHLLSDYQTLFPNVTSPTCISLPSVVSSRGEASVGIPKRFKEAKGHKRCSSPPTYLGRIWVAGNMEKGQAKNPGNTCHGAPLWSPIPRVLPSEKMNGNNNNKHIDPVLTESIPKNFIILEELPEMEYFGKDNKLHKAIKDDCTKRQPSSASLRESLKSYASRVTSSQDLPLDILKVNLLQLYNQGKENGTPTSTSSPGKEGKEGLLETIDDVIAEIDFQRQVAAQKVAGMIAELIGILAKTAQKHKKLKNTPNNKISHFWSE